MPRRSSDELREVIRDFRRDQIIDVARRLFGERGSTEVAMDEIAARAGVARSTVYVYFSNRDELLRACLQKMYQQLQSDLEGVRARGSGPDERLRAVVRGILERIDEDPAFMRLAIGLQVTGGRPGAEAIDAELAHIGLDMAGVLEELVSEGVERGLFEETDPMRAASLIGQQVFGAMAVRAGDPSPPPLDVAVGEICDFVRCGLGAPVPVELSSANIGSERSRVGQPGS
ncbi:MAG: TetR/AcrR family transcriptional regulator [Actinomycetota bacterium]|nr:TetR/AcrR family transcriptional regulator [Actinomycetota bacterium]